MPALGSSKPQKDVKNDIMSLFEKVGWVPMRWPEWPLRRDRKRPAPIRSNSDFFFLAPPRSEPAGFRLMFPKFFPYLSPYLLAYFVSSEWNALTPSLTMSGPMLQSTMVSPYAAHQQQISLLAAQQQALLMAAAAAGGGKPFGGPPGVTGAARAPGQSSAPGPTGAPQMQQAWSTMGYQAPAAQIPVAGKNELTSLAQVGRSRISFELPVCFWSTGPSRSPRNSFVFPPLLQVGSYRPSSSPAGNFGLSMPPR